MRQTIITLFILFGFSLPSVKAKLNTDISTEKNYPNITSCSSVYSYEESNPIFLELDGFTLVADSGGLKYNLDISVARIPHRGGYAMQQNMINVSGNGDGIRLLPGGEHFNIDNPARIMLSYNPERIPMGYKANDIYTYYCDSTLAWHRLERISIDTLTHTIVSITTHFTDFANAIIKVPDMPESKAFVPTMMTDLPDANPMRGIPMIEVPAVNNKGTAELVYPIEVPAGRHGLQPNVDLHYSSSSGNGILGVGWSLNFPAVAIDTRWGVPRFAPQYESEQYTVNGAPILLRQQDGTAHPLPYQNNTYELRSTGLTRFSARDTKNQDRIDRIGTNPTNYWWAVTDRNGITTYYGRKFDPAQPQDESLDENSVIRTDSNCITYWAATASVDVYGNYIRYINEQHGNNIYVRQIDYTGNYIQQLSPTYRVCLDYQNRSDVSSSGRLGVLQTDEKLICHLLVQYHHPNQQEPDFTDNLAAYYMQYSLPSEESLFKTRLTDIVMLDSVHDLRLNDVCNLNDIIDGNAIRNRVAEELLAEAQSDEDWQRVDEILVALSHPYGSSIPASTTHFEYNDAVLAGELFSHEAAINNSNGKELSANHSKSWSIGGATTVGYGPDIVTTLFSGGGNYNFSKSEGECSSILMDMNGDGLPDIVYEQNGKIWYCKQNLQGNGCTFANPVQLQGLTRLSREVTKTHTWGLQLSFGADLSYSNPISTSYTDTYFSDVNADGLPDMIDGDRILINHLTNNGTPSFSEFTGIDDPIISVHNSRCHGITFDGEVNEHIECELREIPVFSYSMTDFFGMPVNYGLGTELVQDDNVPYPNISYADDTNVLIPNQDSLLHVIDSITSKPIEIPNPDPCIASKNGRSFPELNDSLMYRIEGDSVRAYRLEYFCKPIKEDPDIETVRIWAAPKSGTVILTDSIVLLQDTSSSRTHSLTADGVAYTIQHCDSIKAQSDSLHLHAYNYSILYKGTIDANDYSLHIWKDTIAVKKGDILMYRLRSKDNNRYDKTNWHHVIQYTDELQVYDSKMDYICTGNGCFQANDTGMVILSFSGRNDWNDSIRLRVKRNNQNTFLLDSILPHGVVNHILTNIPIANHDSITICLSPKNNSVAEPLWSDVHIIPKLQYIADFPTGDSLITTVRDTIIYYPDIRINHSSLYSKSSPYSKLFGPMHKGWGLFAYQNINENDTIILDSLINTQYLATMQMPQNVSSQTYQPNLSLTPNADKDIILAQIDTAFSARAIYNPLANTNYWIPMRADSHCEQWIAYGNMGCIGQKMHSNAREITMQDTVPDILEYDSSLPFRSDEGRVNNFVHKKSRSVQHGISAGAIVYNESLNFGSYSADVDYMDMNGDGYPDFVGKDGIQYSMPWGGIGKLQKVANFSPFKSENNAVGVAFSACVVKLEKEIGNNIRDGKFHLNVANGASEGAGNSSTKIQFMDVNADGLPDKIDVDSQKVYYNLGYHFSLPYNFSCNVSEGSNINGGININAGSGLSNLPFSIAQVSISGGMGGSTSINELNAMLADINGDGLPDKLTFAQGDTIYVAYNLGNRSFSPFKKLSINSVCRDRTESFSTTLGVTGGFTMGLFKIDFGIQSSPYGTSSSNGEVLMTDMNGDGLVDYVYKNNGGSIRVRYNNISHANLLKTVINPTGHRIELNYSLSEPSTLHRSRQWNLTRIIDKAPSHPMVGAQNDTIEIEYENAYYDNYEKTDYGYEFVRTQENNEKNIKYVYHNQSFLLNGELKEDSIFDADGYMYIHHLHGKRYVDLTTDEETINGDTICDDANIIVLQDGYWTDYYEKESSPQITTRYNLRYDRFHNMIEYYDEGDISTADDDWKQVVTYLPNSANNMISLPQTEKIYNRSGQLLRSSSANYSNLGALAHIHFHDTIHNQTATTHIQYDNYGNIMRIIAPTDANGDNNWSSFGYDNVTHNHVVDIDNPHHVCTFTTYYYQWGVPKVIVDPAGYETHYRYDNKGRLLKVRAPFEYQHGKDHTVKYSYNQINHNLITTPSYHYTHVYKDMYDSLFVQKEVSIFDERGKIIQKKSYIEENGQDKWVVNGAENWDAFGRIIAYGYPFNALELPHEYEDISNSHAVINTSYDILDRPVHQTYADGSVRDFYYNFRRDSMDILRLMTRTTDENGLITAKLTSPQERLIQQEAGDGSFTFFEYSPIGELLSSTDADGYKTSYNYNMLGQMYRRHHPDAGNTKMTYDLAGNLIQKQPENLAQTNDSINYIYDYGRLMEVQYPHHIENNVRFQYDNAGRIAIRYDGTGSEEYRYDLLGNVAQATRRIVLPTDKYAYVFRMQYKYDSFGRMRNIIYPDGEIVHYNYTTGGLLKSVAGTKQGQDKIYLWNRIYDEQGRKIYQLYGNGVWSAYRYDQNRQWLQMMYTESSSGDVLQDIEYGYDHVGNITDITQHAHQLSGSLLGGPYSNEYRYDQQYRLYKSMGYGTFPFMADAEYSHAGRMVYKTSSFGSLTSDLLFSYDRLHQTHQLRTVYDHVSDENLDCFWDKNGNLAQIINCEQDVARLHEWDEENRLKFVLGDRYAGYYGYDANNERIYKLTGLCSIEKVNSGYANAQAILDDAILYPSPYLVFTTRGYTKHYYAGTERLATVIGGGGLTDMIQPINQLSGEEESLLKSLEVYEDSSDPLGYEDILSDIVSTEDAYGNDPTELNYVCSPIVLEDLSVLAAEDIMYKPIEHEEFYNISENDIFYFHGDHLGSANWITDARGDAVQYIHYAPYGELIDNQMLYTYDERYKFTGKERDEETGYDYFGARYLSSLLGHWLSVDPLADKYPNISPYAYCSWNPVKFIDPDGRDDFEVNWNPETNKVTIKPIENKDHDQFHIVDSNGNRIASSNQYHYRTITKLRSGRWSKNNLSLFDVKGDDNAEDLFKFLASNFTEEKYFPLEWSRVIVGTSKSGRNIIGTSMKADATGVGHYIMFHGYTIRGVDHNHPKGTGPSNKDIDNALLYHSKFPGASLRVFTNGEYISYDENTPKRPIDSIELKEIEVIGSKK